jgi:hypothetical protein
MLSRLLLLSKGVPFESNTKACLDLQKYTKKVLDKAQILCYNRKIRGNYRFFPSSQKVHLLRALTLPKRML